MYYHLTFRFPLVEVYGIARRINELLHIKRTRMLSINQNRVLTWDWELNQAILMMVSLMGQ
jgi:hypothetical protein